jgi:chromate transporter
LQTRFEHLAVTKRNWLTQEEFADVLVLASLAPGGNSSNVGLEIARRRHGVLGTVIAYLCLMLPGSCFAICLGALYWQYHSSPQLKAVMHGLECASVALTLSTASRLFQKTWKPFDWLLSLAALIALLAKWPIILVLLICTAMISIRNHRIPA